jgi:hypothetical protein
MHWARQACALVLRSVGVEGACLAIVEGGRSVPQDCARRARRAGPVAGRRLVRALVAGCARGTADLVARIAPTVTDGRALCWRKRVRGACRASSIALSCGRHGIGALTARDTATIACDVFVGADRAGLTRISFPCVSLVADTFAAALCTL